MINTLQSFDSHFVRVSLLVALGGLTRHIKETSAHIGAHDALAAGLRIELIQVAAPDRARVSDVTQTRNDIHHRRLGQNRSLAQ